MKIIADTHTHTQACDHAYSTLEENALAANKKNLKILCSTEHTSSMIGAPSELYFVNLKILPRYINDVMVVRGAEINIVDYDGSLDLSPKGAGSLEWNIASFHTICIDKPNGKKQVTKAWRKVAENPLVHVVGHCGYGAFECNYTEMVKGFAENDKIVEINSHSFAARPGSIVNCKIIAELCAENNVPIVVSSDAHHYSEIGCFDDAISMLNSIQFPQELILNADEKRFLEKLHSINGGKLDGE